jgi:fumarylacetoacetase
MLIRHKNQCSNDSLLGDYTDFYSSRDHATNVGIMFRGVDNALQPNWLHMPIGYHGRSSSIVVSGTNIMRPYGQLQANRDNPKSGSVFGPSAALDFELEMAFFVGGPTNPLGKPISLLEAEDRIFGVVIMNDWSARDIQSWEYVPLGPFTSKNFCTSISPWIVSLDALKPFQCSSSSGIQQNEPVPLPYLHDPDYHSSFYDVDLEVSITPDQSMTSTVVTRSNLRHLYWNFKQQLVHHR